MSLGRLVPWASWDEWRQTRDWILSGDQYQVRNALGRIDAWRTRGRVPLGIEATASFIEAKTMDEDKSLSDTMLRNLYSISIVRMVNGIADSSQKGRVASSVATLAASAGLPHLLVDLRHEATHNDLPSLSVLRRACDDALSWLKSNYWEKQTHHLRQSSHHITTLVSKYLSSHRAAIHKSIDSNTKNSTLDGDIDGDSDVDLAVPAAGTDADQADAPSVYDATLARKGRGTLLRELKSLIPQFSSCKELIDALTLSLTEAYAEDNTTSHGGESDFTTSAAAGTSSTVVNRDSTKKTIEEALHKTLLHMSKEWPNLPVLLLQHVVTMLLPPLLSEKRNKGRCQAMSTLQGFKSLANIILPTKDALLISYPGKKNTNSIHRGPPLVELSSLTTSIVDDVVKKACISCSQVVHAYKKTSMRQEIDESIFIGMVDLLVDILEIMEPCVESTNKDLKSKAQLITMQWQQSRKISDITTFVTGDKSLSSCMEGSTVCIKRHLLGLAESDDDEDQKNDDGGNRRQHRWKRTKEWHPCGIGMLPCAVIPNGNLPLLNPDKTTNVLISAMQMADCHEILTAALQLDRQEDGELDDDDGGGGGGMDTIQRGTRRQDVMQQKHAGKCQPPARSLTLSPLV